ncbi:Hypothetical_protein [Hexamita inflata]|uniref:Hypothetical_protein n=1 Tax=Hexamita inflata TaxID=28002 RepID=A0AA86QS46_9EUKA|nr:Hypothetical protein HINF_LOCUS46283 [Hexamita inflata]
MMGSFGCVSRSSQFGQIGCRKQNFPIQSADCSCLTVLQMQRYLKASGKKLKEQGVHQRDCACNIVADEVEITDSHISDFHCFQVNKLILGQTRNITSFP